MTPEEKYKTVDDLLKDRDWVDVYNFKFPSGSAEWENAYEVGGNKVVISRVDGSKIKERFVKRTSKIKLIKLDKSTWHFEYPIPNTSMEYGEIMKCAVSDETTESYSNFGVIDIKKKQNSPHSSNDLKK